MQSFTKSVGKLNRWGLVVVLAGLSWCSSAETWYLKGNNGYNVLAVNDLAWWTNAVGTVGSGSPSATDLLVVPVGRTLRVGGVTTTAKSVTINGTLTHDSTSTTTWGNDGIFLGAGATYGLNANTKNYSFKSTLVIPINGTMTVLGTRAKPSIVLFQQSQYSNGWFKVQKLACAEDAGLRINGNAARNERVAFLDASTFKGNVIGNYNSADAAANRPPLDDGQFGAMMMFKGLDTTGSLIVGTNFVLGAVAGGVVTRAASVTLCKGSRLHVALSDNGASRVEATSSLTVDDGVQVFVGEPSAVDNGRYPILSGPGTIDLARFTLKIGPKCANLRAALETDSAGGVGTLYLKVNGYNSYYADAAHGNDAWDGSTGTIPSAEAIAAGGTIAGPKKTLKAAMALTTAGDTVYAAEGAYDEGESLCGDNVTSNRVVVPASVTLAATGSRTNTFIVGKISTEKGNVNGCWSNAVRCVCLNAGSVVKGFTLKDGSTCNGTVDSLNFNGGGVWGNGRGLVVDCIITNCSASRRGATAYGQATLLRCRLNAAKYKGENLDFYNGVRTIDSVICQSSVTAYRDTHFYNCTFDGNVTVQGNTKNELGVFRNCLHLYPSESGNYQGRYASVLSSYFCSQWVESSDGRSKDVESRFGCGTYDFPFHSAHPYQPLDYSLAVGKGDVAAYLSVTNGWTHTMRRHFTLKDAYGNDRLTDGKIDLGAFEHVAPTCRYVDAETGDDKNNDGLSAKSPLKTLKAAVASLTSADDWAHGVIHAAPGTYDEEAVWYANCSNRVVVPETVGLVADQGPLVTTIKGAFGDLKNNSKAGAGAVRCVYLKNGAWVRGFTITGGATQKSSSGDWGLYGGGVYSDGGATVACILTGNAGGGNDSACRGSAGHGGCYFGCQVYSNYGNYYLYYNPTGKDPETVANTLAIGANAFYGKMNLLNSTVDGNNNAPSWNSYDTWAVNCYFGQSGRGRTFVNCFFSMDSFKYQYDTGKTTPANSYDSETCRFSITSGMDANHLPLAGSVFVDAGSNALYEKNFPKKWWRFKDVGYLDQQRLYNGVIDVGGGEYDAKGDLARALDAHGKVAVNEASGEVATATDGVTIGGDGSLDMLFTFGADGTATFTVTGDVTVTADGATITPVGGVCSVTGSRGDKILVRVVNRSAETATVTDCSLPLPGFIMIVR